MAQSNAELQRAYRQRVANGTHTPRPPKPLPEPVELTPAEYEHMQDDWHAEYRRVIAAWLIRQRSEHTRRAYRGAWQRWLTWCQEHDIDPIEPPTSAAAVWLSWLGEQGYSPASISQWRIAVRAALQELTFEGLRLGGDPFARIRGMAVSDESTTRALSDDEVGRMVDAARAMGGREYTAILLLAVMGLRAIEAEQVTTGTVQSSPWGPVAKIVRKGGKATLVPLPPVVIEAAAIAGWPLEGIQRGTFANRVTWIVTKVAKAAGIEGSVTPHMFRHWHATAALGAGMKLEHVQDSMGHADPATTQRYNRARHRMEHNSAFVVGNLPAIVRPSCVE